MADSHASIPTFMLALFLMCSSTDCIIYSNNIFPSPSDPCPMHPCLTLSRFASDTSSYLQSNTILIFQPGNHKLGFKLRVGGALSLQLLKSVLPLSANIICEHSSLDLYNITSVHISRLEFIGCGGNRGESIGQLSIKDTRFLGKENVSTALELIRSSVFIKRSSFISYNYGWEH